MAVSVFTVRPSLVVMTTAALEIDLRLVLGDLGFIGVDGEVAAAPARDRDVRADELRPARLVGEQPLVVDAHVLAAPLNM